MDRNAEARRQAGTEEIKYFVNGEEVVHAYEKPPDREVFKLTVREILTSAGFTPPEEYELTSDADNHHYTSLDEEVPVDFGERFTATHKGVTPVSRTMTIGDFEAYVRGLGYAVETVQGADDVAYVVVRDVELPSGALHGRRCDIAIGRNEMVPYVPPAAIHTRPHLVPMDENEPLRTMASGIGPDWQYWSRRYDHRPTEKDLWAHILTVLCDDRWPTS